MTATLGNAAPDPQQIIAELQRKLDESRAELAVRNSAYSERIAYQAAANDVLKVMSASPSDPQPVFDLISVRARDICDAYGVTVYEFDGSLLHFRAATGVSEDAAIRQAAKAVYPAPPTGDLLPGRAILNRAIVHIRDHDADLEMRRFSLTVKSSVVVPMIRGGVPIGALHMGSRERGGFSDAQVELLETFADQAVIAIDNARLFNETKEALERLTATADILKVIAGSPSDVQPVFEAIAQSARKLISGALSGTVFQFVDNQILIAAISSTDSSTDEKIKASFPRPQAGFYAIDLIRDGQIVHFADTEAEGVPPPQRELGRLRGFRSILLVPLITNAATIGMIAISRKDSGAFSDHHIRLLRTFADQAVIAIENTRLFNEVNARTHELMETLQIQTATSEVLKVISRSPDALQPVLDAIANTACELCGSDGVTIFLLRDEGFHLTAVSGTVPKHLEYLRANPATTEPTSVFGQVLLKKRTIHYANVFDHPELDQDRIRLGGERALLMVPLLRDDRIVGVIVLRQSHLRPFTPPQIQAIEVFADQAVIAISNVGLFEQVQQRTRELSQSLDELRTAQNRLVQTEKLASLGQLTAGIAHEIKNPLNFVNNFSAISAELVGEMGDVLAQATLDKRTRDEMGELAQMLKSNLEKVVQHGKRADSIVKNMLLHSREGSGEHRPADINAIVDESLNLAYHGARAEKAGFSIAFQRDLDSSVGMIDVYPQEITRVLLNLISNGFYAATKRKAETGDGFEPTLSAATKNLGDKVEIRIRDNGTGIPEEVKGKIFNPFFTTKPSGEGTGLGLSMSHDIIVKQHGGSIDVETEPGLFTEFKIVLPRTSQK